MSRVYSYVVAEDGGYAPNVDGGVWHAVHLQAESQEHCKSRRLGCRPLASPKPQVRYLCHAGSGGCCPWKNMPSAENSTIRNLLSPVHLTTYTSSIRFWDHGRREDTPPDLHPEPAEMKTDIDGRNVLIADRFWYFGGTRCELPERFWKLDFPKPRARRNHRTESVTDTELDTLIEWLDSHGSGVIGSPRDGVPQERGVYRAGSAGCGPAR